MPTTRPAAQGTRGAWGLTGRTFALVAVATVIFVLGGLTIALLVHRGDQRARGAVTRDPGALRLRGGGRAEGVAR